jgi:hypothetical protein
LEEQESVRTFGSAWSLKLPEVGFSFLINFSNELTEVLSNTHGCSALKLIKREQFPEDTCMAAVE